MEYTAEQIYQHIDSFTDFKESKPKDTDTITVYVETNNGNGFIKNILYDDLGLEELVSKKWILQSELDTLLTPTNN